MERLNITLDDEHSEKLARLSARTHVQPEKIARCCSRPRSTNPTLTRAASWRSWTRPPGLERATLGLHQAHVGLTIALDEL